MAARKKYSDGGEGVNLRRMGVAWNGEPKLKSMARGSADSRGKKKDER